MQQRHSASWKPQARSCPYRKWLENAKHRLRQISLQKESGCWPEIIALFEQQVEEAREIVIQRGRLRPWLSHATKFLLTLLGLTSGDYRFLRQAAVWIKGHLRKGFRRLMSNEVGLTLTLDNRDEAVPLSAAATKNLHHQKTSVSA